LNFFILAVVSALTLGLEILLTRVFSVVLFASHSFLAISLALLGTGAGAVLAYFAKPLSDEKLRRRLIPLLALLSAALVISLWGLLQIDFVPQQIENTATYAQQDNLSFRERVLELGKNPDLFETWKLYCAIPLAFMPFLLAGYVQALIFRTAPAKFGLLYGFDLVGATIGSLSLPFLLSPLGLRGTVLAMAIIATLPLAYALVRRQVALLATVGCAAPIAIMIILWGTGSFHIRFAAGFQEKDLIREHWSPMSRVALLNHRGQEMYTIDNGSRTFYAPKTAETFRRYLPSLYTIGMQMKQGGDLLVIASGGGQELSMASFFGMNRIDAVEIAAPIVTDILQNRKDDPGNPYLLPNVNYFIADGRSVIMRSDQMYDMIEMLDVNFATVAGQISHAWSPNFVSTQEAFSEYMAHLKEDGILCYSTISLTRAPYTGDKGRRLASLVAGMKLAGIAHPEDQIAIFSRSTPTGYRTMFMAKRTPFTRDDMDTVCRIASSRKDKIAILFPDMESMGRQVPESQGLQTRRDYIQGVIDVCRNTSPLQGVTATLGTPNTRGVPITDDRPYTVGSGLTTNTNVFEALIGRLYRPLLILMAVLVAIFLALPFIVRRPAGGEKVKINARLALILSLTGVGFMFLEMVGIYKYQLYLHHPTIAMIVVLSSIILGSGLGSLHSSSTPQEKRQSRLTMYSTGVVLTGIVLFLITPTMLHRHLLGLPMSALLPLVFCAFAGLGFLLGHIVPLGIDRYANKQPALLAWCWAITVTGSVVGTVLASILARDYGVFLLAILGIISYLFVAIISLTNWKSGGPEPGAFLPC
jgi:hypothetical protein